MLYTVPRLDVRYIESEKFRERCYRLHREFFTLLQYIWRKRVYKPHLLKADS